MSTVPSLFAALVDDAAVFPPGSAPLPEAIAGHRRHRAAWYADLVGPLLLPATMVGAGGLAPLIGGDDGFDVGVIGETDHLAAAVAAARSCGLRVRQVEAAVANRGEDPLPGLGQFAAVVAALGELTGYAEIPLTWGFSGALDELARLRRGGARLVPKFRTGGLAAELFPSPLELAQVICACRDRQLDFKLTAGLHRAIRHGDPGTGFVHHGFLNVLAATLAAAADAALGPVTDLLASSDPVRLVDAVRAQRGQPRPMWAGFGTCSVAEPVADLVGLGLLG